MKRQEKVEILRGLSFGKRVAEEEVDNLKSYFVYLSINKIFYSKKRIKKSNRYINRVIIIY